MLIHSPKDLAQYVRSYRKDNGLSQIDLSKKSGLLQRTISNFENQPDGTKLDTLFRILSSANLQLHIIEKGSDTTQKTHKWKDEW